MSTVLLRSGVRVGLIAGWMVAAVGWAPEARAEAAAAEPHLVNQSVTLDVLAPPLLGGLLNTWGSFFELQTGVHDHFSLIAEFGYLKSNHFRPLPGGSGEGLRADMATYCAGVAWWYRRPLDGPFVSVRVEGWLAAARNDAGVTAIGNVFDANFQPGWQWQFGHLTMIASVSIAYATGPIRSPDGTVEFPLHGLSGTPHLRLGYVW